MTYQVGFPLESQVRVLGKAGQSLGPDEDTRAARQTATPPEVIDETPVPKQAQPLPSNTLLQPAEGA